MEVAGVRPTRGKRTRRRRARRRAALVGCGVAAVSVYLAAAGAAQPVQPGHRGSVEPAPGLQGWGKLIQHHSNHRGVGVWAVEESSAGSMPRVRPQEFSTPGSGGLTLQPIRAMSVVVKGKAHGVLTNAATVGELLSAMRIEPDGDDRVVPPPSTPLSRTRTVTFAAVDVRTATAIEGGILRTYRVRSVNGRVVGRSLVWSRVLRPASPTAERSMVGEASWYYIDDGLHAASPWLPFGTVVTVTNLATGASVTVVINDRGPFGGRIIDLSEEAFSYIAPLGQGVADVRIAW